MDASKEFGKYKPCMLSKAEKPYGKKRVSAEPRAVVLYSFEYDDPKEVIIPEKHAHTIKRIVEKQSFD